MKLWLDDVRPAPKGWVWAHDCSEAFTFLRTCSVGDLSLDHDLGGRLTGHDFLTAMAHADLWPTRSIAVHSMNPVGKERMEAFIEKWAPERLRKPLDA